MSRTIVNGGWRDANISIPCGTYTRVMKPWVRRKNAVARTEVMWQLSFTEDYRVRSIDCIAASTFFHSIALLQLPDVF